MPRRCQCGKYMSERVEKGFNIKKTTYVCPCGNTYSETVVI